MTGERTLCIADPGERENLAAFVTQAMRLDDTTVVRLRRRAGGRINAWVSTGFDALAVRACEAELAIDDATVSGDVLLAGLRSGGAPFDLGYSLDSTWRGTLPPDDGFVHVDNVPARVLVELARQGVRLAREHGSTQGPPASLLDQEVIEVTGERVTVGVPMRVVFALTAMGFIPYAGDRREHIEDVSTQARRIDSAELVRVRVCRTWLRLDARYGSVAKRKNGELPLYVR